MQRTPEYKTHSLGNICKHMFGFKGRHITQGSVCVLKHNLSLACQQKKKSDQFSFSFLSFDIEVKTGSVTPFLCSEEATCAKQVSADVYRLEKCQHFPCSGFIRDVNLHLIYQTTVLNVIKFHHRHIGK